MENKKELLNDDELDKISGGAFEPTYKDIPDSPYLNKYVRIKDTGQCGQIIQVRRKQVAYFHNLEYIIRLNAGGEVTLISTDYFEELPPGVIDVQYSPDGHGASITF